jgi:hypothetical protein
MKIYERQSRYPVGSVTCSRRGYIKIKVKPGGERAWIPESHAVMERERGKAIAQDERVFHIGLNKSDNRPENLVVIKIRLEKYALLPTSKVLYIPTGEKSVLDSLKERGLV